MAINQATVEEEGEDQGADTTNHAHTSVTHQTSVLSSLICNDNSFTYASPLSRAIFLCKA